MLRRWLTERRRERLLASPFPDAWPALLEREVRAYRELAAEQQAHLRDLVQVFVAEKHWEGCGGLELLDEHRVAVAGNACLVILGRDHDLLREIESILIYPTAMVLPDAPSGFFDGRPRVVGAGTDVLGLAHHRGPMVLAWDAVRAGGRNPHDGRNVVIHEVAHKIDFLDGEADGTPPLDTAAERRTWAHACSEAYLAHRDGSEDFLRAYATTNEAEFFAVATEMYFERPTQLARELPALHAVLHDFYRVELA